MQFGPLLYPQLILIVILAIYINFKDTIDWIMGFIPFIGEIGIGPVKANPAQILADCALAALAASMFFLE